MRTIHEILIDVRKYHIMDIQQSKRENSCLYGLCTIAHMHLSIKERDIFIGFLEDETKKKMNEHFWSTKNTDRSRLKWLDKHIELTKP